MSDPNYGDVSTGASQPVSDPSSTIPNSYQQASYTPPAYGGPPPYGQPGYPGTPDPYAGQPAAAGGLSDTAAGALAYVTIIPAIIFLVMAPYNTKPFVKFHAFQCLGLAVLWFALGIIGVIPILGWIVFIVGSLATVVMWIMCIVKASQGGAFKLPVIGNFAAQQSGYPI